MTKRIGNVVIIKKEPDKVCARCKTSTDCREVVKPGEFLCLRCTTEEERRAYGKKLFGGPTN